MLVSVGIYCQCTVSVLSEKQYSLTNRTNRKKQTAAECQVRELQILLLKLEAETAMFASAHLQTTTDDEQT